MPSNTTQITPPRVPLTDERTGAVSREWYRWFYNLYEITGGGTGITPVINGGTGLSTIPTNGQLLIGNGSGYTLNTLTAGSGITVTNAAGVITLANSGVLSWSGGATGLTPAVATTGAVTLAGTLAIANGGTNSTAIPTAYGVAYGTGTAYAFTAAGTTKQALLANTGGAPTWATLTTGASILYGDGSGGFSNVTIGTGVSFAGGTLSATGSGGTVTAVTGTSPVVSSGGTTPAISLAAAYGDTLNPYASKTANYVLAAPNGSAGVPTFRALVATDIPSLSYVTSVSGTTGRITSTGGTTPVIDLDSGVATPGTTGSSTQVPVITIDTYGRVTSITTAANPQGTVTSVTGTAPIVSSGGTTPAISMAAANGSTNGYLTSTDWTTFNNKGSVTSVAATVPSFLSISGSPITTSGTLAIGYSGTALPVANGGTGLTSVPHTVTIYTSGSGTYTTPANCKALYIRMVGGGGNGGGSTGITAGGGGGAGGYLEAIISSPAASYTYAVGAAGGNTTFDGSTYSANAGTAGTSSSAAAAGGAGGTASGGNLNMTGATGGFGWASPPYYSGGFGAGSPFGSGGSGGGTGFGNGFNGVVFGSGGGGAVGGGGAGSGFAGLIVITEVYV